MKTNVIAFGLVSLFFFSACNAFQENTQEKTITNTLQVQEASDPFALERNLDFPKNWIVEQDHQSSAGLDVLKISIPNSTGKENASLILMYEDLRTEINQDFNEEWESGLIANGYSDVQVFSKTHTNGVQVQVSKVTQIENGQKWHMHMSVINRPNEEGSHIATFSFTEQLGNSNIQKAEEIINSIIN